MVPRIALFPVDRPTRREQPIPLYPPSPFDKGSSSRSVVAQSDDSQANELIRSDFLSQSGAGGHEVPVYETLDQGLAERGWSTIPKTACGDKMLTPPGAKLGHGAYGYVILAFMKSEERITLETRHLAAVKVQPNKLHGRVPTMKARHVAAAWIEVNVLRGCVHDNIVAYYDHFVVRQQQNAADMSIVMPLEYASAGTLEKEVRRFKQHPMPESGILYYAKQVIRGVAYLHRKFVTHNDLHNGNILLRYNRDATKTAMIADFGGARVHDVAAAGSKHMPFDASYDLMSIGYLIEFMAKQTDVRFFSPELRDLLEVVDEEEDFPTTMKQMLDRFPWFKAVAVAPIPKEPTPLLDPDTVTRMGYLPRSSDQRASPQAITLPALPSPQSPSSHQSLATEGMGYVAFPLFPPASPSHPSPAAHSVHSPKPSSRSPHVLRLTMSVTQLLLSSWKSCKRRGKQVPVQARTRCFSHDARWFRGSGEVSVESVAD